jgi:hypothetical protein
VVIYEVRTYTLTPGGVPEFEKLLGEVMPCREKFSPLRACWHTEIGSLNQVVHVWPYKDLEERRRIREESAKDPRWPPHTSHIEVGTRSDIYLPAPFSPPLEPRKMGNIYEMRTYTYKAGSMREVLKRWEECIPHWEKHSPLAASWYTDLGELNLLTPIWPYENMAERDRIRAEAVKDPHWPPHIQDLMVNMENKILVPAKFSPLN